MAVRLTLDKTITVCSIYIPPSSTVTTYQLDDLLAQLPTPYIIMGDFNGHSPLWGSTDTTIKGRILEDFISSNDLCLFNDGSNTYLHPGYGTYTAIDLTICDPSLYLDFTWEVTEDLSGSDHFPIFLKSIDQSVPEGSPRWKFRKADWSKFSELCSEVIIPSRYDELDCPVDQFTEDLICNSCGVYPEDHGSSTA